MLYLRVFKYLSAKEPEYSRSSEIMSKDIKYRKSNIERSLKLFTQGICGWHSPEERAIELITKRVQINHCRLAEAGTGTNHNFAGNLRPQTAQQHCVVMDLFSFTQVYAELLHIKSVYLVLCSKTTLCP